MVEIAFMDTDSIYAMFGAPSLEESVHTSLKDEFEARTLHCCSQKGFQRHAEAVLPRKCCSECELVDNKWPGLWKVRNVL